MTGKEFYTEFFGVKDPKEKGTTINVSVWRFAEAYAERLKQGQSLPIDSVSQQRELLSDYNNFINNECILAGGILTEFEIKKFQERNCG